MKMRRGSALRRCTGIFVAVAAAITCAVGAQGVASLTRSPAEGRSDMITIDSLKQFGVLERQPVVFFHDAHTSALLKKGKDCQACHPVNEKGVRSLKFQRFTDTGRKAVMDVYHVECITCHRETRSAGEKSGPEQCGECHLDSSAVSDRQPMGFDLSLHYRHSKALDKKCEQCHHDYDPQTKKLFYNKGKEGSCRYCHGETSEENRVSMPIASHLSCIACHEKILAEKKDAGPVECSGCHDPEARKMIEKVADLPRMKRNQPDVVFVSTVPEKAGDKAEPDPRMAAVPFNHKAHETYNDTCRVCHHADLNACSTCHTPTGAEKGSFVSLENAMHRLDADQSCIGCHETRQQKPQCAACHAAISSARSKDPALCATCHMAPAGGVQGGDRSMQALRLLDARTPNRSTFPQADIPEKVIIKSLSKDYEPVELPHRKIVNKLVADIQDSRMAEYFHQDPGTVCQGCHHNSPVSKKPPLCGSCHGEPFQGDNKLKPGLTAAYHRQCMECHETIGLAKPDSRDCVSCHIKKKTW